MGLTVFPVVSIWHQVGPVGIDAPGETVFISSAAALGDLTAFDFVKTYEGDIVRVTGFGWADWKATQQTTEAAPTLDIKFWFGNASVQIPTLTLPFVEDEFPFSFLFLLTFRYVEEDPQDVFSVVWKADGHVLLGNNYWENWMLEGNGPQFDVLTENIPIDIEATLTFRALLPTEWLEVGFEQCVVEYLTRPQYDSSGSS